MLPFPIISQRTVQDSPRISGVGSGYAASSSLTYLSGANGVVYNDRLYMFEGWSQSSGGVAARFIYYDLLSGAINVMASPPTVIGGKWMGLVGDYIYIGGGRITNVSSGSYNNTVYRYSITNDAWETLGTTSVNSLYLNGAVIGNNIYSNRGTASFIDVYNTSTGTSSTITRPFTSAGISASVQYNFISSNGTDTIYASGVVNPTTTPTPYWYSYNINTMVWTNLFSTYNIANPQRITGLVYNPVDGYSYAIAYLTSAKVLYAVKNTSAYTINITGSLPVSNFGTTKYYNNSLLYLSANSTSYKIARIT